MGFHKRRITTDNILYAYKNMGIYGIKSLFKADAIMISDEFSSTIFDLVSDKKEDDAIKLLHSIA